MRVLKAYHTINFVFYYDIKISTSLSLCTYMPSPQRQCHTPTNFSTMFKCFVFDDIPGSQRQGTLSWFSFSSAQKQFITRFGFFVQDMRIRRGSSNTFAVQ